MRKITVRNAIKEAILEEMRLDEKVIFIAEDQSSSYSGTSLCSELTTEFGPSRIFNAPRAQAAFSGAAVGASMLGLRPIVEFASQGSAVPALEQILNAAANASKISGNQLKVPVLFRLPANTKASGQISDLLSLYCQSKALLTIAPSNAYDSKGLLKSALRDQRPVVWIESQEIYDLESEIPEEEYLLPLGKAEVRTSGRDISIFAWSKNVILALEVAKDLQQKGYSAEVLDLRTLSPLDSDSILQSVSKTNRALILHDQESFVNFAAQLSHLISSQAFDYLDAPVSLLALSPDKSQIDSSNTSRLLSAKEHCIKEALLLIKGE